MTTLEERLGEMTAHEFGPAVVGGKLRALRRGRGWSQEDLAGRLDRTQTAVSYWEAGKRAVGWEDLLNICDVFDVPPSHFLPDGGGTPMPKPNLTVSVGADTILVERQVRIIGMHLKGIADRFVAMADDLAQLRRPGAQPSPEQAPEQHAEQPTPEST